MITRFDVGFYHFATPLLRIF